MEIKELYLENFRGFENLKINFSSKLAVFIGRNGAGKSSVLDAIAILLNQYDSFFKNEIFREITDNDINTKFNKAILQIIINASNKSYSWSQEKQKNNNHLIHQNNKGLEDFKKNSFQELYKIRESGTVPDVRDAMPNFKYIYRYYESSRALYINEKTKPNYKDSVKSDNFNEFLEWFEIYENLENEVRLRKDINYKLPALENVRKTIQTFFGNLSNADFNDLRIVRVQNNLVPNLTPAFVINKGNIELRLEQLSDGEKMALMIVVDIARSLVTANPESKDALNGIGIVLIDEIELHLHPSWQREIIPALTKTFPNVQFIVSTHSPQVLSNVAGKDVFIIEDFKLINENIFTKGRDSKSILYDIFGEEKRPKEYKEKIYNLYESIEKGNKKKAAKLLGELREKFGNNDVEIQRALMYFEDLEEADEVHKKASKK